MWSADTWNESNATRCRCCSNKVESPEGVCGHCGSRQFASAMARFVTGGGALVLAVSVLGMLGSVFVMIWLFRGFLDPDHATTWRVGVDAAAGALSAGGFLLATWCVTFVFGGFMYVAGRALKRWEQQPHPTTVGHDRPGP